MLQNNNYWKAVTAANHPYHLNLLVIGTPHSLVFSQVSPWRYFNKQGEKCAVLQPASK